MAALPRTKVLDIEATAKREFKLQTTDARGLASQLCESRTPAANLAWTESGPLEAVLLHLPICRSHSSCVLCRGVRRKHLHVDLLDSFDSCCRS